jgi:hypothetical protein
MRAGVGLATRSFAGPAYVDVHIAHFVHLQLRFKESFNIKAFRLFTGHQTGRAKLPKDIRAALPSSDKKNLYYKDTPGEILRELWRRTN